jgi:hypothetical protein
MNPEQFTQFLDSIGKTLNAIPANPFRGEWARIKNAMAPHYYGDVPDILKESFPNEDPQILEYRKKIYSAKTESPVVKAMTDLHRLLSTSKHSVYFDNKKMEQWYEDTTISGQDYFSYFFSAVVPMRILDPNAVFLVDVPEAPSTTRDSAETVFTMIQSDRIVFNDPEYPLFIYQGTNQRKYTTTVDWSLNGIYHVVTDQFYGTIKEGVLEVIYEHKSGVSPWFTLGGRAIPRFDDSGNKFVVYKSDFSPAVPYLNDAAVYDNQHKSVMLSTCFPIKFVDGITCDVCNGIGKVADENSADGSSVCGGCSGLKKKLFLSPLAGYNITPDDGYNVQAGSGEQRDPIRFYSPEIGTITMTGEQADKSLAKAEEVLDINRAVKLAQSGVAKDIDREGALIQVSKIATDLYSKMQYSLEIKQAITFMSITDNITVIAPVSFDLKSESELMAEFTETQKGAPVDVRYNAYYNFIQQRYANDLEAKRMAEISVQYSTFILFTPTERAEMVASGQMLREDAIKAANVFEVMTMLINENKIDIFNEEFLSMRNKIDVIMTAKIDSFASVGIDPINDANMDDEEDPTLA